jgi:hypothetical protein
MASNGKFLEHVAVIMRAQMDDEEAIESVLRMGGCVPLMRISEEGSFDAKREALGVFQRVMERGGVKQKCLVVELGMLEFIINMIEAADGEIVRKSLDVFLEIIDAEELGGWDNGHREAVCHAANSEAILELAISGEPDVRDRVASIEEIVTGLR